MATVTLDPSAAAELFPAASPRAAHQASGHRRCHDEAAELSKSFTWRPSKSKRPSRAYSGRRRHSATVRLGTPELCPGGLRTSEVPGLRTAGEERRELMRHHGIGDESHVNVEQQYTLDASSCTRLRASSASAYDPKVLHVNYFGKLLCADSLLMLMKQLPAKQGYLCSDGLLWEEKEDKELVLLVGTGLQHVVAQLALQVVEATTTNSRIFFGHCEGAFNLVNG
ncbi:hypothetical protein ACQ4PT_043163 [Festuca glaucescens]